jgi:peptidoglycan hydrolase-like protein with peptidoglycan-binding domain
MKWLSATVAIVLLTAPFIPGASAQTAAPLTYVQPLSPAGVPTPPPTVAVAEPLAPEVVRAIQGRLRQLGFYPGQIDGLWGPAMQSSIERFQQGRGLQATGQLNPATVTALGLDPNNLAAQTPVVAPAR